MMFKKIQRRLLLSYLLVLTSILGRFAIAVRIVFSRNLTHQLTDKLTALGQGAAANTEYENVRIKLESDFRVQDLNLRHQALQWFDTQGNSIGKQGENVLNLPIYPNKKIQFGTIGKTTIQAVTLPIIGSDNKKLIGYIRASQSLEEFNETLNKLDWGLGGGVIVALLISGVGGVWLTRQAMQPIEESFERLKQFTADASHELRSPLMVIKSNTAVALKYPEGIRETDAEKFQAITSATNQMTHLTEDLLFLARYDKLPNQGKENINIAFILDNLIKLYEPQAVSKKIILKYQLNENMYIRGDSIELIRLFTNLIQNAIHYTPLAGTIEITASRIGSHITVDVKDTGVGIAPDHLEKVFERFWRADKSRSYNFGGSGLGLAIAQAIAQNHGGLITVTSQLEIGSCFTVRLPASLLN